MLTRSSLTLLGMEPNDMNFEVHVVDTNPKTRSRYNQWLYSETLNLTASNAIEEAIPGRTHKWIVVETNTNQGYWCCSLWFSND